VDDQTRLDENMANFADMILAKRDPALPEDFASQARIIQVLNQVIEPGESMDAGMRSRLNQRINEEWDYVQHRKKSRLRILNLNTYSRMAVAASLAIVVAIIAIVISMNDTSGSDVSATAQGDSSALLVVSALVAVAFVSGFLYFLWNRRR
jgi:hypothetical protein